MYVYVYMFVYVYMSSSVLKINSGEIPRKCGLPLTLILQQGKDNGQY